MTESVCTKCNGNGLIQVDDLNARPCICLYARAMAAHLGPEISQAKGPKQSPLLERREGGFDGTTQNLFLKGYWHDLLPHFKYALSTKGLDFSFRITTDEKLKSIYLGAESYKARSVERRDDMDTYNSLADFVEEHKLLILRLGFLGYKNIAMPGIIKEALLHREVRRRPTWIIESPDSQFQPGHLSYSDELDWYIKANFKTMDFRSNTPGWEVVPTALPAPRDIPLLTEGNGMSVEEVVDQPVMHVVEERVPYPSSRAPEDGFNISSTKSTKKWSGKKGKKPGSGGGMDGDFNS